MASKPTSHLKSAHGPASHYRTECTHPNTSDSVKFYKTGDRNNDKWAMSEQGFPHGSCVFVCRHTTAEKGQQWMKMRAHKHTHIHAEQGNGNTNRSEKQPEKTHTLGNANWNCGATLLLRLRDIPNRPLPPPHPWDECRGRAGHAKTLRSLTRRFVHTTCVYNCSVEAACCTTVSACAT